MSQTFYDFSFNLLSGHAFSFADLRGKVALVVNTASKCGFTPQYEGLESLYEKYAPDGLEILGFPSDDFMHQEPGIDSEIAEFCKLNYGVTFPMFSKSHVRGKERNEVFNWLCSQSKTSGPVLWNFEKFLVSRDGTAEFRYRSIVSPDDAGLRGAIRDLLQTT